MSAAVQLDAEPENPEEGKVISLPGPKDPVRKTPMCRLQIGMTRPRYLAVSGGHVISRGTCEVKVHHEDAKKIQKLVEHADDDVKTAERAFNVEIDREVDERYAKSEGVTREEVYKKIIETTAFSVARKFHELFGRDMLPLDSVKILEKDMPPLVVQEEFNREVRLIEAFQKSQAGTLKDLIDDMVAQKVAEALSTVSKGGKTK